MRTRQGEGHSRWGAQEGRQDKDKGFTVIPPCWGGAGMFPVADVGAHVGVWGERSRLGCEMTHVVKAGSYSQLFLFCQWTFKSFYSSTQ